MSEDADLSLIYIYLNPSETKVYVVFDKSFLHNPFDYLVFRDSLEVKRDTVQVERPFSSNIYFSLNLQRLVWDPRTNNSWEQVLWRKES
jgi:hypothetical protein